MNARNLPHHTIKVKKKKKSQYIQYLNNLNLHAFYYFCNIIKLSQTFAPRYKKLKVRHVILKACILFNTLDYLMLA